MKLSVVESVLLWQFFLFFLEPSSVLGIPADFECSWRKTALEFAAAIQPDLSNATQAALKASMYDDFGSPPNCPEATGNRPSDLPIEYPKGGSHLRGDRFFVAPSDSSVCSDSYPGSYDEPFCTLMTGVDACRQKLAEKTPCAVLLQGGIHRLRETIRLSDTDSGLEISSAPNEQGIISGAVHVDPSSWQLYSEPSKTHECVSYTATDVTWGHDLPGSGFKCTSSDHCIAACKDQGCACAGGVFSEDGGGLCFLKSQAQPLRQGQSPSTTAFVCSACNANVWVTTLPEDSPSEILSLYWDEYTRGVRARYPNSKPEFDLAPVGYIDNALYLPPPLYKEGKQVVIADERTNRTDFLNMFTNFTVGVGGDRCAQFDPEVSYWCSSSSQFNQHSLYRLPSGLNAQNKLPNAHKYKNISQALITVWHPDTWSTWMFDVDRMDKSGPTFVWTKGGFQGGRGSETGGLWNIQNVFEELDDHMEWFFNSSTRQLFVAVKKNSSVPSSIEVASLKSLLHIEGKSPDKPATNILIHNLSLVRTAYTYMDDDHSVPSGGDWAMGSSGVVYLENTENVTVSHILATQLDGNAIMIRGYNVRTSVMNSKFNLIGGTAVAMWGKTGTFHYKNLSLPPGIGPDGTQKSFVFGAVIESNVMERLGIVAEKQVACTFQAKTANITIRRNLCFRNPRAGFLINDGFYGGHLFDQNLLFNNVMETGDHGPINFWDRQSFFWNADGTYGSKVEKNTTTKPFRSTIKRNFMVANYGAGGGCVDSDDGTSYHDVEGNVCLLGGFKSDNFQGHAKRYVGNLNVYPNTYGPTCIYVYPAQLTWFPGPFWPKSSLEETYANNTCVVGTNYSYAYFPPACNFADTHSIHFHLGNNTIIAPDDSTVMSGCGGDHPNTLGIRDWLNLGVDKGTIVINSMPTSSELMHMAWNLLFPHQRHI